VRALLPISLARPLDDLLHDQPSFFVALDRLPATLCHHDAAQANLFARRAPDGREETVAVDWEEIGPGAVGAEIATLVFGTLRRGDIDVEWAEGLDRVTFDGYLTGLHDAGWRGDARLVRLGFAAAVALRWYIAAGLVRMVADDALRATAYESTGLALDELIRRRLVLVRYLLERADEARRLGAELGLR
jgi:hypothetical protein